MQSIIFLDTERIIRILGIIMTVCAIFVVTFYFAKKAPLFLGDIWKDKNEEEEAENESIGTKKKKKNQPGYIVKFIKFIIKLLKTIFRSLESPEILYYLAYGSLAVIGTVVHPFFFAFHLTVVLVR